VDVERHHHRDAELEELDREVQVPLEVRRVHDIHDDVGALVREEVARDDLLLGVRRERVRARQVDEAEPPARVLEGRLLLLDRDARPVADMEPRAGDGVDDGRLAGVGVPGDGDRHRAGLVRVRRGGDGVQLRRGGHGLSSGAEAREGATSTPTPSASFLRSERW
jgi:hypothetical protein